MHVAADAGGDYTRVPPQDELRFSGAAAYVHFTPNETIGGVEFGYVPRTGGVRWWRTCPPVSCRSPSMSAKFGLIYAGAQKNIGPAGFAIVIVREDLIGRARAETPRVFDYQAVADAQSMLNTPPTFAWYMAGLVFKWLKKRGGVAAMGERNRIKAQALYAAIDGSALYQNPVANDSRSRMNVTFTLGKPELDAEFLAEAAAAGCTALRDIGCWAACAPASTTPCRSKASRR